MSKKIEFETKIININIDKVKNNLNMLGAKYVGIKNFKRYTYDFNPININKWIRLRTDGKLTTLTIKEILHDSIDGTSEIEIEVSDFDATHKIIQELGYKYKSFQENVRESYILNGVNVDIDSWPLIPCYVEVEGKSKNEVEETIELLGFNLSDTCNNNTIDIYKQHGIDLNSIQELKF